MHPAAYSMLQKLQRRKKFALLVWNLNNSPVILYNAVKELVDLSASDNFPKTQAQIINIGVEMIQKNQYFETGISECFKRLSIQP